MNAPTEDGQRGFRLQFTILDEHEQIADGLHAAIALVADSEHDTPALMIQAGGVPASEEGAGIIADMLRDAADAIDEHLGRERKHVDTASMPTLKPKRRPFNPQPAGGKRS